MHSPQIFKPDPPDCICLNASGLRVAIEVSEVVCEEATLLTAKGNKVYRVWKPGELTEQIEMQLGNKDRKKCHGGEYEDIFACLFTDEPALTVTDAGAELGDHVFGPFSQLTGAFLLFSYDPATHSYPVLKLRFSA